MTNRYRFQNGRREGTNPSSRVIESPSLESQVCFADQSTRFELGFWNPSLESCLSGDRSHLYRKDRCQLHLFLWSSKSSKKLL